jgi:hypothetical protein
MHRNTPLRLIRMMRFHSCSVISEVASVVEGNVKSSELFESSGQSSLHVFSPTHVALPGKRTPSEFLDHACRLLVAFPKHRRPPRLRRRFRCRSPGEAQVIFDSVDEGLSGTGDQIQAFEIRIASSIT